MLGTSVPWLMPQVISDLEAATEKGADGSGRVAAVAEWARQEADLEHWPAFGHSFARLAELIREACRPRGGDAPPATGVRCCRATSTTPTPPSPTCTPTHPETGRAAARRAPGSIS